MDITIHWINATQTRPALLFDDVPSPHQRGRSMLKSTFCIEVVSHLCSLCAAAHNMHATHMARDEPFAS